DPKAPTGPQDCPNPAQFNCRSFMTSCWCDPSAPADPSACPTPSQFKCEGYFPVPSYCSCDPSAPASSADCPDTGVQNCFTCASMNPRYGCTCACPIIIR